jgi:hypothetical protein
MSFTASALVLSWVVIGLLGFALAGVLARVHRLEQQAAAPQARATPVGQPLPLPDVEQGPLLALFVDRDCGACERAADGVDDLVDEGRAVVYWRDEAPEVFGTVDVPISPFAIVADERLRVVAALPVGSSKRLDEAVAALVALDAPPSRPLPA